MSAPRSVLRILLKRRINHKKLPKIPLFLQGMLFASMGISIEVLFTAIQQFSSSQNSTLTGHSYIWMFPVYGLIPVILYFLYDRLGQLRLVPRIFLYVIMVYAVEYSYGTFLKLVIQVCPWEAEYRQSTWNVNGLIRLDFFPLWAVACYFFEWVYLKFNRYFIVIPRARSIRKARHSGVFPGQRKPWR